MGGTEPGGRKETLLRGILSGDSETNIEPGDREEALLAGILRGDTETNIEPGSRKEALLKAILENGGGGGGGAEVEPLSVTENGTYTADAGKAYSPVTVAVPNSYLQSDEGKVVYNSKLVPQTPHTMVTSNGTIDTTINNSVEVAVPASAVDAGTKEISTNGTHDVVGYASARVNVPNSYNSSDEGKVVSNGALIAQVAHALVTANGVIDTTLNNSVEIAVPSGGIEFPSDWFVDSWTQESDSLSKTWTHGLGQQPRLVVCICCDSEYGSDGRILDMAFAKPDGTWVQSGVASANSNETSVYWSQSIGYNGYTIDDTTITLTQGRYYSATFKSGKKYLLVAHK